ncbi:RabGAP/TBC [Ramaria rubella]|nr:RabGAP/TBC [Ramaria rubella]
MDRPSVALLESVYAELFRSPLDKLLNSALDGRLFAGKENEESIAGRSIAWKLFLAPQPPLTASLNPHPVPPLDSLRQERARYVSLLREKMSAPDGSYEEGFQVPGDFTPMPAASRKPNDLSLNNPLSLDSSNPWHAYFSAIESRNTIRQDVERTFPEIPYFRSRTVQTEMTHILFIHAGERENVGYRQGMHELLACIYRAVDYDSVDRCVSGVTIALQELCDRMYVAADAYALFKAIMQRMETWYEWRTALPDSITPISPLQHIPHFSANGEMIPPPVHPQTNTLANGQLDLKPYVAPIVSICASLRDEKLRAVDPHLWEKLREGSVEPQMYGMRWLRLLFTREFALPECMVIWDGLFASAATDPITPSQSMPLDRGFELALWISVAMLIRIRNNLIPGDYTEQLTHLLRYPAPPLLGASQTSNAPALLLCQARLLMTSPTPGTGVLLVMQNRNELGIAVEIPDAPSPLHPRRRASVVATTIPPTVSQGRSSHTSERSRLQDVIANRLMDANETLGLQRGFFNTLSELRKNLPDLSQTLIKTPSWNGSSISLIDERTGGSPPARKDAFVSSDVDERPPWEPKPRSEVEREINELRELLKTLGNAVGWAVDVLLLDEDDTKEINGGRGALQKKKAEAVECMAYVRDILSRGGKGDIDEERLVSEEEYRKRRSKIQEKERVGDVTANADEPSHPPKPVLPPPPTASSGDQQHSLSNPHAMLSTRNSAAPVSSLTRAPIPPLLTSNNPSTSLIPTTAGTKKVAPPWAHTPSNFLGDSPYATGSLPRLPPPSTTAPLRKRSDHTVPQIPPGDIPSASPRADPLGVLR